MEMDEDVCYSTVFIKKAPRSTEREETTIYSEVKSQRKEATQTDPVQAETEASPRPRLLQVCLWILCFLLTTSIIIIIIIIIAVETNSQQHLRDLTAENQRLLVHKRTLQNRTEELSRERDDLNRTLRVILTFDSFPVNKFCPEKTECRPCRPGWVLFEGKCYLFYNQNPPWMSWEESRRFCQNRAADLVVVDDLREQEFISGNVKFYFDEFHGFWLGLQKTRTTWVWVDGRNDTLGFWISEPVSGQDSYVLLIPGQNLTKNWSATQNIFLNKFICEHEALTRSS